LDVDIRGLGIELDSISKQNSIGNMLQYQISSLDVKENSNLDVDIRGLGIELDPISKQNSIGNMLQYQISSLDAKENSNLESKEVTNINSCLDVCVGSNWKSTFSF
jgi:hypothetical protein